MGEGKFARVYQASSLLFENDVAIRTQKISEMALFSKNKLKKQANKLVQLVHPNVVQCYGVVLDKRAFVLECCCVRLQEDDDYVTVHSLLGLIRTLEEDLLMIHRLNAISDIAAGLSYLHDKNVIVGDLKPSNVLVTGKDNQFRCKLSDLNLNLSSLTRSLISMSYSCNECTSFYALFYLAPELITSELNVNAKQNPSTDIFAFSITMYEVLFPQIENIGTFVSHLQFLQAIRKDWRPEIPDISTNIYSLPYGEAINVMKECWNKDPSLRPNAKKIYDKMQRIKALQVQDKLVTTTSDDTNADNCAKEKVRETKCSQIPNECNTSITNNTNETKYAASSVLEDNISLIASNNRNHVEDATESQVNFNVSIFRRGNLHERNLTTDMLRFLPNCLLYL